MPEFADYEIWLCSWDRTRIAPLMGNDFMGLRWQHTLNQPGSYRLELVAETTTKDDFVIDYGVQVMRNHGSGFYEEFYGIHLNTDEWLTSGDVDEHYWASEGMSPDWLLSNPMLQPLKSQNPNWVFYDLWWAHGAADDVVKQMASESMGGGALSDWYDASTYKMVPEADADSEGVREVSNFTVEGETGEGEWSCYEGRWVRLLQAMQDATGIDGSRGLCDFRVVPVYGGFELRTYAPFYGTDRRKGNTAGNKPTVFSLELENVLNPRRRVNRATEAVRIYGGWQGGGMERQIYMVENAAAMAESPYRRRELFLDLRDVSSPDTIPAILRQALIDYGKQEIVTFDPIQTNACMYGQDWSLGDLVTLELWGGEYDMRITEAIGEVNGEVEERITGKAELWTRSE